jgi:hypothetical protein
VKDLTLVSDPAWLACPAQEEVVQPLEQVAEVVQECLVDRLAKFVAV